MCEVFLLLLSVGFVQKVASPARRCQMLLLLLRAGLLGKSRVLLEDVSCLSVD